MTSDIKTINASNWHEVVIGHKKFYTPNIKILELIKNNPYNEFWRKNYNAFAILVIDGFPKLIRDHFGLEPFFYSYQNNTLIFASNIPDILKHYQSKLNYNQVMNLLIKQFPYDHTYTDETYYQNIFRVEPGTEITLINNKFKKNKFW